MVPKHRYLGQSIVALIIFAWVVASAQGARRAPGQAIPVRFTEGTAHGFLDLHSASGTLLASGDLTQVAKDGGINSRMTFHFPDGSVFEETVLFTQQREFALRSYHLVQRGPAFVDDLDASLLASGAYQVTSTSHHDGRSKRYVGTLDLPADVSNGMVIMLLKNLQRRDTQTVHVVAFTPKPRVVELALAPGVEFVEVDSLDDTSRGDTGHGASGGFGERIQTAKD